MFALATVAVSIFADAQMVGRPVDEVILQSQVVCHRVWASARVPKTKGVRSPSLESAGSARTHL